MQRKGAVLRRGRPAALPQRPPSGNANALKGYSLPLDISPHAAQPPAQHASGERTQRPQHPSSNSRRPAAATVRNSSAWTPHAGDSPAAFGAAAATAAAADEQATDDSALNGHSELQNGGSRDASHRLTGKKRKLVGTAQQAGIVSGILAKRQPEIREAPSDAHAGA